MFGQWHGPALREEYGPSTLAHSPIIMNIFVGLLDSSAVSLNSKALLFPFSIFATVLLSTSNEP